jgi:hypothetical protein
MSWDGFVIEKHMSSHSSHIFFWLQRRLILFSRKPIGVNLDCSDCSAQQLVKDRLCWNVVGTPPVYSLIRRICPCCTV